MRTTAEYHAPKLRFRATRCDVKSISVVMQISHENRRIVEGPVLQYISWYFHILTMIIRILTSPKHYREEELNHGLKYWLLIIYKHIWPLVCCVARVLLRDFIKKSFFDKGYRPKTSKLFLLIVTGIILLLFSIVPFG